MSTTICICKKQNSFKLSIIYGHVYILGIVQSTFTVHSKLIDGKERSQNNETKFQKRVYFFQGIINIKQINFFYSFNIDAALDVTSMRTDERNTFDDDEASKEMIELLTESRTM